MSTTAAFHFEGPGGPISSVAFKSLLARLPGDAVNVCLKRYKGYVLGCETVGVKNTSAGATLCVTAVTAVVGCDVIDEQQLECAIPLGQTDVFLTATAAPESLDPIVPAGLQAKTVRGVLTTDTGDRPKILLAKCCWVRGKGEIDTSLEAVPDRTWWPPVLRVADHPFSQEAADELRDLLGEAPVEVIYTLASAARGEDIGWPVLIRDVLAIAAKRFREQRERAAEVDRLVALSGQADLVSALIRLLRADFGSKLRAEILIEGKRFRLANVLRDARPSQRFGGAGSEVEMDCGEAAADGWLAVVIEDAAGSHYRIVAEVGETRESAFRRAGRGTEPLIRVAKGTRIKVTIGSETSIPSLIGVGFYVASVAC